MDDILEYLEELTHPESRPSEYCSLLEAMDPLTDKIKDTLSLEFLDQLDYAQADILNYECREAFSRGFRLGVQLILAALAEPSVPDTRHRSSSRQ